MKKFTKRPIKASADGWQETDYSIFVDGEKQLVSKYTKEYDGYRIMILPEYNRKNDTLSYLVILFEGNNEPRKLESFETSYDAKDYADNEVYDMYVKSINSSRRPAPKKRTIKASEAEKPVVMYFDGKKVYEGDINDIYSTIVELCKDEKNNQIFMEYLNQFGDPFDFDGTPEDTAETFAAWVGQDFDDAEFNEEDFYVQDTINGKSFEIFLKSDEAVEGSVQRRAKKSVKASKRPAPKRQAIKADEIRYTRPNGKDSVVNTDYNNYEYVVREIEEVMGHDFAYAVRNIFESYRNELEAYHEQVGEVISEFRGALSDSLQEAINNAVDLRSYMSQPGGGVADDSTVNMYNDNVLEALSSLSADIDYLADEINDLDNDWSFINSSVKASVYKNYEISDANKYAEFLGKLEDAVEQKIAGADGMYNILGAQFVEDYGYVYEIMVQDLDSPQGRPTEIGYITIDYTKSPGGGMYAYRGDDEETTFATGKTFDDILDAVAGECAIIVEDYENFK